MNTNPHVWSHSCSSLAQVTKPTQILEVNADLWRTTQKKSHLKLVSGRNDGNFTNRLFAGRLITGAASTENSKV